MTKEGPSTEPCPDATHTIPKSRYGKDPFLSPARLSPWDRIDRRHSGTILALPGAPTTVRPTHHTETKQAPGMRALDRALSRLPSPHSLKKEETGPGKRHELSKAAQTGQTLSTFGLWSSLLTLPGAAEHGEFSSRLCSGDHEATHTRVTEQPPVPATVFVSQAHPPSLCFVVASELDHNCACPNPTGKTSALQPTVNTLTV